MRVNGGCKDTSSFHSKMQNQTVGGAGKGPATRGQPLGLVCGQEDDNVFHAHSEQVHSQGRDGT